MKWGGQKLYALLRKLFTITMKINAKVLIVFLVAAVGCAQVKVPVTYLEAEDPTPMTDRSAQLWQKIRGLESVWASKDSLYSRSEVPFPTGIEVCHLEGWRGETLNAQFLLYTGRGAEAVTCKVKDLKSQNATFSSDIVKAQFVRYTLADMASPNCRCYRDPEQPAILSPDLIDTLKVFNIGACSTRPVWVTVSIPHDAKPGIYESEILVSYSGGRRISMPFTVEVIDQTLPEYKDWKFHLDLWQHPSAVARMENLEMWSDEHFDALRKQMLPLAQAGQKVITATLNRDPWGYQTFDDYEDMILWTLHKDGTWSFDYTVFDRWVELMMSLGVNKMINCYSMLPWENRLHFFDEKKNERSLKKIAPGSKEFEMYWGAFLTDFVKHLDEKGWLEITNIAADERHPEDMVEANRVLTKYAPQLGFAMADKHGSYRRFMNIKDCCVAQRQLYLTAEELAQRREQGFVTTFYVCCSTYFPNNFTYSQPFESELLPWHAITRDYDGMLRWAYNSWPYRPEYDSRFRYWGSGDTYMIGSHARHTMRFDRTKAGIQAYEKVRILREKYSDNQEVLKPLEDKLAEMNSLKLTDYNLPWAKILEEANTILNEVSRQTAK